jgi:transcriptional regulator with XRE-family HTH domain
MNDDSATIGRALAILRSIRTLDQAEVARAAGVHASAVSEYESGKTLPSPRTLERILRGMDLTRADLDAAIGLVRQIRSSRGTEPSALDAAAERLGSTTGQLTRLVAANLFQPTVRLGSETVDASLLWERLRRYGKAERQAILRECPEFRSGTLCRLLCKESVRAAADKPERAEDLAKLALEVASLLPGDERRQSRVQGYAWGFVGNARRTRGDLTGADAAFGRSAELWKRNSWEPGSLAGPELRDTVRLLDLETSLRHSQGRFPQALELLGRAMALDGGGSAARLLIQKARALGMLDDHEGAVAALWQAAPHLENEDDPRLVLCQRFNLIETLSQTGRWPEAMPMLPGVREEAARLGNELDLLRIRWVEGRIDSKLGETRQSMETFRSVRDGFMARGLTYDAVLVTLEAAMVVADSGQPVEVQRFARESAPLFAPLSIDRDVLAALENFCHAAESQRLTGTLARQLFIALRKRSADL